MVYIFRRRGRKNTTVKTMFKIKIVDTVFEIHNIYGYIFQLCKDYIYSGEGFDFQIFPTQKKIDEERQKIEDESQYSDEYIENICVYREICLCLLNKDAFVMHGAAVGVGAKAYIFTAKSGTGKSTHIALWKKILGDKVYVINGDKPILRYVDDKLYVYGTPWCGKEMWQTNTRAELGGICFLERANENKISALQPIDTVNLIMKQILVPNDAEGVIKTFDMVDKMLKTVKLWKLGCNISAEAAVLSYTTMHGGNDEN